VATDTDTSIAGGFRWRRAVQDAVTECIATNAPFTIDDVWERLGRTEGQTESTARMRAMGWVMRDAARTKRIVKTGATVKGRYSVQGSPVTQWKAGNPS
jgi:hypothetical protein